MNNILGVSALKRFLFFLLADVIIVCVSLYLSFLVHFEFNLNIRYLGLIREMALFFIVVKVLSLAAFRVIRDRAPINSDLIGALSLVPQHRGGADPDPRHGAL